MNGYNNLQASGNDKKIKRLSNGASEFLMLSENFDQLFAALKRNQ